MRLKIPYKTRVGVSIAADRFRVVARAVRKEYDLSPAMLIAIEELARALEGRK